MTPTNQTILTTGHKTSLVNPKEQEYINASMEADAKQRQLLRTYNSHASLTKDQRIKAVKSFRTPPEAFNPYDRLHNALWRWSYMGNTEAATKLSPEKRSLAASNFYDKMIKPAYDALGVPAMPKDLWMKQAYGAALKYDPSERGSYSNSLWKGFLAGGDSGVGMMERLGGVALDVLGSITMYQSAPNADWNNWMAGHAKHDAGLLEKMHAAALAVPGIGWATKHLESASSEDQFWHDVLPSQNFTESASSMVTEQAALLPLYEGVGAATKLLGVTAKVLPAGTKLTEVLNASKAGRRVIPLLTSGVEGAVAGGVMTAPGEDWKREAWQSAAGFMIGHTVFGLTGSALEAAGSKWAGRKSGKLGDLLEGDALAAHNERLEELELGAKGQHIARSDEEMDAYKKAYASYASAAGAPGIRAMAKQAIEFLQNFKGSGLELLHKKQDLIEEDPAKWNPVFNVARVLQELNRGKKLSSLSGDEITKLFDKHDKFISSALDKVGEGQVVQDISKTKASQVAKTPSGQAQIQRKIQSLKVADAKTGMNKNQPDSFYQKRAEQWYTEQNAKAAVKASKIATTDPAQEVQEIAKKRKDVIDPTEVHKSDPTATKSRAQYSYDDKGRVTGYSLRVSQDFNVYARKAAKAEGFGNLKEWFADLSDGDFIKDLQEWFYPKDLSEGGFFFEHEGRSPEQSAKNSYADVKNPNFLAFMYNYVDHMPPEMQQELKTRLTDQAKVSLKLGANVDEERLIRYYALQMWNHVDDFLAALPQHKGEFNLFRSTQSDLLNPTKYQMQLLEEKMAEERKNLTYIYRKQPEVLQSILAQYDGLAAERYRIMKQKTSAVKDIDVARALRRQDINLKMGEMQTEGGKFDWWRF